MDRPAKAKVLAAAALVLGASDMVYLNVVLAPALARASSATSHPGATAEPTRAGEAPPALAPPKPEPPRGAGPPSPSREAEPPRTTTPTTIEFERGSTLLDARGREVAERAAQALRASPRLRVRVRGHTDATGSLTVNMDVSWGRAKSVATALTELGIEPRRIQIEGRGSKEPVASDVTESGRAKNRRAELLWET